MELTAVVIAIIALVVSVISMHYSQKAYALSLFDKRYKLFHEFKVLITKMAVIDRVAYSDYLQQIRLLLWEAQYIFGKDVCMLFNNIYNHANGCIEYFDKADSMAAGNQPEDYELIHRLKTEHYDAIKSLPSTLLSDDNSKNLNSYFNKYLSDRSFKKPLHYCQ